MIYLGTLDRLIELKCPATQRVSSEGRHSFTSTLEGRVKAQVKPLSRRVWDVQMSDATRPDQVAAAQAFAIGAWGPGPFIFVPADAPFTNLLTPDVSYCAPSENQNAGILNGGPAAGVDVVSPRSYLGNGSAAILFGQGRAPVLQGRLVTASAYVLGASARVRLNWYGPGGLMGYAQSPAPVNGNSVERLHVTSMPPAGATGCIVSAANALQAFCPAATWTDSPVPWSDGRGCATAVLDGPSSDLVLTGTSGTRQNLSFTIREVN